MKYLFQWFGHNTINVVHSRGNTIIMSKLSYKEAMVGCAEYEIVRLNDDYEELPNINERGTQDLG